MATQTEADRLRGLVGEPIPPGGTAADTLFSSLEIQDLLTRNGSVDDAIGEAWEIKAAKLASLVDVQDGDQRRALSQAFVNAQKQARWYYDRGSPGVARSRVRRITREGFQG